MLDSLRWVDVDACLNKHKKLSLWPAESREGIWGVIGSGRPCFLPENSWKRAKAHTKTGRRSLMEREGRWRRGGCLRSTLHYMEQVSKSHGDGVLCLTGINTHSYAHRSDLALAMPMFLSFCFCSECSKSTWKRASSPLQTAPSTQHTDFQCRTHD